MSKPSYLDGYGKNHCDRCGLDRTPEGNDGCVGTLEGVKNACCGHGEINMAYVQFDHEDYDKDPNKVRISGQKAINYIFNQAD